MKTIIQCMHSPWFYLCIIAMGIALKFYGIEKKFFWYDEIETIMHVSGISDFDYPSHVPVNEIENIRYYHDLLHVTTQDYTVGSQLTGMFSIPLLTPLHPALLIFWTRIAGDDFVHYRLFNVFLFLLLLPVLFLLCKILFGTDLSGWIAISLLSVSPFFNIFTQEARYIILWVFFASLCHLSFLKTIENDSLKRWVLYVMVATLAMYTCLLSSLVLFGHLVFIVARRRRLFLKFSISLFAVVLLYLPWMITLYRNMDEILRSLYWQKVTTDITLLQQIPGQLFGMSALFVYFIENTLSLIRMLSSGAITGHFVVIGLTAVFALSIIIMACIHFIRKDSSDIKWFLLTMTVPSVLFIAIIDIVRNGWVSFIWRYHIITLTGILLIVANYLAAKIKESSKAALGIYFSLVVMAVLSILHVHKQTCPTMGAPAEKWDNYLIAEELSRNDSVLVVTDFSYWAGMGGFLEVMAKVDRDGVDILYAHPGSASVNAAVDSAAYSNIFIVHASDGLLQSLRSNVSADIVPVNYGETTFGTPLWRVVKE